MILKLLVTDETIEVSDYIGFCLYNDIATLIKQRTKLFRELTELHGTQIASEIKEILDLEESIIDNIAMTIDQKEIDIVNYNYLLSADEKKYYRIVRGYEGGWSEGEEGDFNEEMDINDLEEGFEGDWDLYNETMEPF